MNNKLIFLVTLFLGLMLNSYSQIRTEFVTSYGIETGDARESVFYGFNAGKESGNKEQYLYDSFIGHQSGRFNTVGSYNSFLGRQTGFNNISGSYNTFIGTNAGHSNQTGNNNIFLGYAAGYNELTSNKLYIANSDTSTPLIWGDFYNNLINLNAKVGVSLAPGEVPLAALDVNGVIKIRRASSTHENSPGLSLATNDDFNYYGKYINHYGFGFYDNQEGNEPHPYISGYYGMDFFTRGKRSVQIFSFGQVGIGLDSIAPPSTAGNVDVSNYKLFVKGGILTEELRISLQSTWADYVFRDDYKLPSLPEVENYIKENGHLPNVPSAKRVKEDGIELGEMAKIQQEKIEELTLYLIQQNKEIQELKAQLNKVLNKN